MQIEETNQDDQANQNDETSQENSSSQGEETNEDSQYSYVKLGVIYKNAKVTQAFDFSKGSEKKIIIHVSVELTRESEKSSCTIIHLGKNTKNILDENAEVFFTTDETNQSINMHIKTKPPGTKNPGTCGI